MRFFLKDGTGAMSLKHLSEDADRHGNTRLYVRRNGRKIRLREVVGTDAFLSEYRAAIAATNVSHSPISSTAPVARDSLRWLVTEYYRSADFARLDASTRTIRRRFLDGITATHGTKRFTKLGPKHLRALRDEKAIQRPERTDGKTTSTPHAANNLLKTLRVMFRWAVAAGHMEANPAREVEKIKVASDGFHTWTVEEIATFLTRHPPHTKAGLAIYLLLYLGVRRSDVVKLGPQMETGDGWLRMIETKGRNQQVKIRDLPILDALEEVLRLHRSKNLVYLTTSYGKPFTANGFGGWFRDRCDEAALYHCSAHGLRKAGATIAADNGATEHQLMALYGWASPRQAEVYTRRANRKKLAGQASRLVLLEDQKQNITVPLFAGVGGGGANKNEK